MKIEATLHQAKQLIKELYAANPAAQSILLESQPGLGKSDIVQQAASELKIGFKKFMPALLDPSDIRGLIMPDLERRTAIWFPPTFLPTEADGPAGISFADEVTSAAPAVQSALYQYALERRVGEHELPPGWMVLAAGNRLGDRAIVYHMSTALANRFMWLRLKVDVDEWVAWAVAQSGFNYQYIGWVKQQPNMLMRFEEDKDIGGAFPTPRSVAKAARLPTTMADDLYHLAVVGLIGDSAAASFFTHRRFYDKMPALEPVLTGKSKAVPESRDITCAFLTALAAKAEKKHLVNLVAYADALGTENVDLAMYFMTLLKHRIGNDIVAVPGFLTWLTKHGAIFSQ